MAADSPCTDAEDPDNPLRPVWEDTPDETDADRRPRHGTAPGAGARDPLAGSAPLLLAPLAEASDALARLDARTAATDDGVREGLLARLALREAAGWLAHAHAWVHPLDLALQAAGLTAPAALAALGTGARALPHTLAQPAGRLAWDDPPLDTLPEADQAIGDALALARLLRRLPGGGPHPFANATATAATLSAFGARPLACDRLAAWWDAHAPPPVQRRRFGVRQGTGQAPLPPLLGGAIAAQAWMESGLTDPPEPAHALLAGFGRLVRQPPARTAFVPLWSAYPAVGFGDRDALPTLRSDAADRLTGSAATLTWPAAARPVPDRRKRPAGFAGAGPAGRGRGAGQGGARRHRPPIALVRHARCAAARAGADAKGARLLAQGRATDRDRATG